CHQIVFCVLSLSMHGTYIDKRLGDMFTSLFFFFLVTRPSELYTLSLHDALPISRRRSSSSAGGRSSRTCCWPTRATGRRRRPARSEEHTSELQSREKLVCRLLLEKKKVRQPVKSVGPCCLQFLFRPVGLVHSRLV